MHKSCQNWAHCNNRVIHECTTDQIKTDPNSLVVWGLEKKGCIIGEDLQQMLILGLYIPWIKFQEGGGGCSFICDRTFLPDDRIISFWHSSIHWYIIIASSLQKSLAAMKSQTCTCSMSGWCQMNCFCDILLYLTSMDSILSINRASYFFCQNWCQWSLWSPN